MAKEYILIERRYEGISTRSGQDYWRLEWLDPDNCEILEMTVDSGLNNFTRCHWDQVIAHPYPFGRYQGLRRIARTTQARTAVLDADHAPRPVAICDSEADFAQLLESVVAGQEPAPTRWQELFHG